MAKFNLKKFSQEIQEKQLEEGGLPVGRESTPDLKILDKLLDDKKNDKEAKTTIEDQLSKVREKVIWNNTVEAQLDSHEVSEGLPKRTGEDSHQQLPINLLEERAHQEKIKAFSKQDKGEKVKTDPTVPVGQKSQLQNHPERFKGSKVRDMVTASLRDADAMLYYIYRTAASEHRELNEDEQSLVEGITKDKIQLTQTLNETL